MFQVLFPCKEGNTYPFFQQIMPSGWNLEPSDQPDHFLIIDGFSSLEAGQLRYMPYLNTALILADEVDVTGKRFWQDFALWYPELNPFDLRYGVLYQTGCEGVYDLDELPKEMSSESLDRVARYGNAGQAYYVTFFLGDWHCNDEIRVQTHSKIGVGGCLGPKMAMHVFRLGSVGG